jgi:hypothetical protein
VRVLQNNADRLQRENALLKASHLEEMDAQSVAHKVLSRYILLLA